MNKFYHIEGGQRIYSDNINIEDIFYSELNIHLLDYLNNDTKIFYLKCESKHNFSLNKDELNYLKTWGKRYEESLYFVFSENIKIIKCFQRFDLFFLTELKDIDFLILIPKLDENNKYYFNLVVGVNNNFDINFFYNLILKSVSIKNINELTYLNLNEDYLNQIFDLLNNKFRNNSIHPKESLFYGKHFTKSSANIDSKLNKTGRIIFKKISFKQICFHFYWFNNKVVKLQNMDFYMDYGYKDVVAIKNNENKIKLAEFYYHSCFLDIILDSPEYICFISWELYTCL